MNINVKGFFKLDPDENKNYVILDKNNNEIGTLDIMDTPVSAIIEGVATEFETDLDIEKFFKENDYSLTTESVRWVTYNPNPKGKTKATDCTIRAYCAAENMKWEDAYDIACEYGKENAMMPNDGKNCEAILTEHFGYTHFKMKKAEKEQNPTVKDFCVNHPEGTYILDVPSHLVCVIDGEYYDTWDCGKKKVKGYYKK